MAYLKLELKKVGKNMLTWLILGLFLCLTGFLLLRNAGAPNQNSIRSQVESSLSSLQKEAAKQQAVIQKGKRGSHKYRGVKAYQGWLKGRTRTNRAILTALDENNWQQAYHLLIKVDQENIKTSSPEIKSALSLQVARYRALQRANLPEKNDQNPTTGLLFCFQMLVGFLPVLFTLAVSFILSSLYASKYTAGMNKAHLLPTGKIVVIDIALGLLVASGLFLAFTAVILLTSSLFFGLGALNYPVLGFVLPSGRPQYLPLHSWLFPTLIITALAFVFIVLTVLLLTQISRSQLTALFLSLVLLLGGAILPLILRPIEKFAHLLPTTYILAQQVVTGNLNNHFEKLNLQLNFATGCWVLLIAIAALLVLNLLWPKAAEGMARLHNK